ncbi:MAG TPA: hypothetical protein VFO70_04730, partial [Chitinophagaceae bacterium]|nr:hypothetical protein [Chitinophagaceae bacterium]
MNKQSLTLMVFVLIIASLGGCKMPKKYYYVEDRKEEEIIKADSDSSAYMKAFENFQISLKVYNDMIKSLGSTYMNKPSSFELLNDKRENIKNKIFFATKDSFEISCARRINELPNTIEKSISDSREEYGVRAMYDTAGLYLAPVKVLSAKFVTKEYSNYKDISLSYKNVSGKKIEAIRFRWYGENSFNEPADMGGILEGWGGGFDDDGLKPGAKGYGTWGILSKDGK